MKLFIAGIAAETSTFVPFPTAGHRIDLEIVVTAVVDKLYQTGLAGGRALLGNPAAIRVASGIDVAFSHRAL